MLRTLGLSVIFCLLGGTPLFAQRELTVTVELNKKVVLRTQYTDDGTQGPVDVWRYILQKEPAQEPENPEIKAKENNPLQAYLRGDIVLRIDEKDGGTIGRADLKELSLIRKLDSTQKWYLESPEVYRTAFAAGLSDTHETETYYKRLEDPFLVPNISKSLSNYTWVTGGQYQGWYWWYVLVPVLLIAAFFVAWMYIKDSKSISWYFSVPLALMRLTLYGLIAYMFLLPTVKETRVWKPKIPPMLQKNSRVVVVLDVSESMSISDDPLSASNRRTRLQRVVELISDERLAFMKKLLENNPVYVYRFASQFDTEANAFQTVKASEGGVEKLVMK
ncbi:MAG: hypothetical protein K8T89_22930, partial [Planctomycetes bacterium]|nr:hypothetical protein [Planctomycetota bacterium]